MKYNLILSLMVAILLSLVVSKIVYFGFTPNYAADIFSRAALKGRLDHDVYQYRILCKYLLYAVDDWLGEEMPAYGAEPRLQVYNSGSSERFYLAFYYLNATFLVMTSILVVLLLDLDRRFRFSTPEKSLIVFLVPIVIGITQFTVAFYDVSSYFFQLLILYIFLRFSSRYFWTTMTVVGLLIILSTMNRESSALSVSLVSLLLLTTYGWRRKALAGIGVLVFCFLATYIVLHVLIVDPQHLLIINTQAGKLLIDTNIMGLIFWGLFFYLPMAMATDNENRYLIGVFFIFCLPYIFTCLKDGVMWEVRLYVPLFLGSMFLSKLDVSEHAVRIGDLPAVLRQLKKRTAPSRQG